jgi:hypothetical protein
MANSPAPVRTEVLFHENFSGDPRLRTGWDAEIFREFRETRSEIYLKEIPNS